LGEAYEICALRPTGVYGLTHPPEISKWFRLVKAVVRGETVECQRGGKEVHAADVARAVGVLLTADGIAGESFNCYDRYVSEYEIATLARRISGSTARIIGEAKQPKHQIETGKIRAHGMEFGGGPLLEKTVSQLIDVARHSTT
jgi:nucleoside-diphosphate-sugar epimerase